MNNGIWPRIYTPVKTKKVQLFGSVLFCWCAFCLILRFQHFMTLISLLSSAICSVIAFAIASLPIITSRCSALLLVPCDWLINLNSSFLGSVHEIEVCATPLFQAFFLSDYPCLTRFVFLNSATCLIHCALFWPAVHDPCLNTRLLISCIVFCTVALSDCLLIKQTPLCDLDYSLNLTIHFVFWLQACLPLITLFAGNWNLAVRTIFSINKSLCFPGCFWFPCSELLTKI